MQMNPKGCDNVECHADSNYCKQCPMNDDKKTVTVCGFCEKPITGEPVMRTNMTTDSAGVTTFFHADCAERVDAFTDELAKERSTLITFSSGAVRYPTGRRYDLISEYIIGAFMPNTSMRILSKYLLTFHTTNGTEGIHGLIHLLMAALAKQEHEILDLYAQALDEGAKKYGDRNWEKGIPESNLVNHAIAHAIKIEAGDTSEDHVSHLIWNVMTIIHFRLKDSTDSRME